MTRKEFSDKVTKRLGAKVTLHTRRAWAAWMQAEGGGARNNPMNTTLHLPGSWRYNFADVQNYPTSEAGVEAMVATLKENQRGYSTIRRGLRENVPANKILEAVGASAWGTDGKLALEVLDDIKHKRAPNNLAELEDRRVAQ